ARTVTGVQRCALPIYAGTPGASGRCSSPRLYLLGTHNRRTSLCSLKLGVDQRKPALESILIDVLTDQGIPSSLARPCFLHIEVIRHGVTAKLQVMELGL